MSKRIVLSDSSLNRYGYRVLTSGIQNLESFKKNPVMLYMHLRDEASPIWCNAKAIGHWEDIQIEGDVLSAIPVFDKVDDLSKEIAAKFEAGTFNAASVGIRILGTSSNKELLLPGQSRETVTEWDLMEASIVDIPANANAVRLYDRSTSAVLAVGAETNVVPEIKKTMNLKATWKTVLAFLGIEEGKAEATELTAENIELLNAEMHRLQTENAQLTADKATTQAALDTANGQVTQLQADIATKDATIADLTTQVENLKSKPADASLNLAPKKEPLSEEPETFAQFCEKANSKDYAGIIDRMKEEGLI